MVIRRRLGESFFAAGAAAGNRKRAVIAPARILRAIASMSLFYHSPKLGERPARPKKKPLPGEPGRG
jgi:hypothetical protein